MVSPVLPQFTGPNHAPAVRAWRWVEALSEHYAIHLACPLDGPAPTGGLAEASARRPLRRRVADLAVAPLTRPAAVRRRLAARLQGRHPHTRPALPAALAERIGQWTAGHSFEAGLAIGTSAAASLVRWPVAHTACDLFPTTHEPGPPARSPFQSGRGLGFKSFDVQQRRLERWIVSTFDTVVVADARDAEYLAANGAEGYIRVARLGVELPSDWPPVNRTAARAVCFMDPADRPSVRWLRWFVAEAWPRVKARAPESILRIALAGPCRWIHQLADAGSIEVVGPAAAPRRDLDDARVLLCPPAGGRGLPSHALDAMALARPVIFDRSAESRMTIDPDRPDPRLIAGGLHGWTRLVTDLIQRPELADRLGRVGRQHAEALHDWDREASPIIDRLRGGRPLATMRHRRQGLARAA